MGLIRAILDLPCYIGLRVTSSGGPECWKRLRFTLPSGVEIV